MTDFGGQGVFIAALRDALISGEIDIAVHSLKDLPTTPDPRLVIAAIPQRVDPRDCLVARDGLTLGELPQGRASAPARPVVRPSSMPSALASRSSCPWQRRHPGRQGHLRRVRRSDRGPRRTAPAGCADEATEVIDPLQMLPPPGRVRLPASAAPMMPRRFACSPDSTTSTPESPSPPSAASWPPSRPAVQHLSELLPKSPQAMTVTSCGSVPWSEIVPARPPSDCPRPACRLRPPRSVNVSLPRCSPKAPTHSWPSPINPGQIKKKKEHRDHHHCDAKKVLSY